MDFWPIFGNKNRWCETIMKKKKFGKFFLSQSTSKISFIFLQECFFCLRSDWASTHAHTHSHMHTHAHSPTLTCTLTRIHTRHIHSFIGLKQNKKQFETLGTNWPGIWYIWPVIWALSDYDIMWICSDLVNISQALIFDWFLTKK